MKKNLLRTISIFILCALVGGNALANVKSKNVHFNEDVSVGGTVVKKGDYKVSFDDQTKELTISSGKKIIVKTTASLEESKAKTGLVSEPAYRTKLEKEGGALLLTSVYVGGASAVIGDNASAATVTAQ